MNNLKLFQPQARFKDSYVEGVEELVDEGYLKGKLDVEEIRRDFPKYLRTIEQFQRGQDLPGDFSPQSEFWLMKDSSRYVGTLKIRHRLGNDYLRSVGGHIGYYIRPSERSLGYGSLILSMGLNEAKVLGLTTVLITCHELNIKSQKVIERNGGVFESMAYNKKAGNMRRYWFTL